MYAPYAPVAAYQRSAYPVTPAVTYNRSHTVGSTYARALPTPALVAPEYAGVAYAPEYAPVAYAQPAYAQTYNRGLPQNVANPYTISSPVHCYTGPNAFGHPLSTYQHQYVGGGFGSGPLVLAHPPVIMAPAAEPAVIAKSVPEKPVDTESKPASVPPCIRANCGATPWVCSHTSQCQGIWGGTHIQG
eukprot:NODE_1787_length_841_cov_131.768939_g1409_i0.p1 GENE.NODE_1787_length_841_cov_131.768939_g1409_i0~~NODE_1787_length_841_cov_131.768939_g1409_i0.p1  ORF type:complete len:188 (+),score=12.16 NODE_1787_length_841_cov_131.768939_g1409_i0:74-637(+)